MKVAYISDIHLEFSNFDINNEEGAELLILAGDILVFSELQEDMSLLTLRANRYHNFLMKCSERFENVAYVLGNHEFYHSNYQETSRNVQKVLDHFGFTNIRVLSMDNPLRLPGVTVIGDTLWTDLNGGDVMTAIESKSMMSDYRLVSFDDEEYGYKRKLLPLDTANLHEAQLNKLKKRLDIGFGDDKIVVVTHHAPSRKSVTEQYKDQYRGNGNFVSDLDEFVENSKIDVWIHGHVHSHHDYMIGSTRILCNPRGYAGHERISMNAKLKYFDL